eukprot:gene7379-7588_t
MTPGELLLQSQLIEITEKLAVVSCEAEHLRQEREELQYQIRYLHQMSSSLSAQQSAIGPDTAEALKQQLEQVRQELDDKALEVARLEGDVRQKEASVVVFQQAAESLRQQLEQLQRQLAAPDAASPSFVKKQRQELTAAEDWKLEELERLQDENGLLQHKVQSLQQELHDLERHNHQLSKQLMAARAQRLEAAAETGLIPSTADTASAADGRMSPSNWASVNSSGPQQELTFGQLSVSAAHLQQAAVDRPGDADGSPGDSSRQQPQQRAELTVDEFSDGEDDAEPPRQPTQQVAVRPAAAAAPAGKGASEHQVLAQHTATGGSDGDNVVVMAAVWPGQQRQDGQQEAAPLLPTPSTEPHLPRVAAVAASNGGGGGGGGGGGAISAEAGSVLKALVTNLTAAAPDQVALEHKELCDDWEVPFNLEDHEKLSFRQLLPHELQDRPGVLMTAPHTLQEVLASGPGMLNLINRQLDGQLASYGIHPGRTGLSNLEFVAAMRMLNQRRAAWAAGLSPEQQEQVEVVRLALLLHPYNTMQDVLQQQQPADVQDGKQRLPGPVVPLLTSAVLPPGSQLPPGPPPVRVSAGAAMAAGASLLAGRSTAAFLSITVLQLTTVAVVLYTAYMNLWVDIRLWLSVQVQRIQAQRHIDVNSPLSSSDVVEIDGTCVSDEQLQALHSTTAAALLLNFTGAAGGVAVCLHAVAIGIMCQLALLLSQLLVLQLFPRLLVSGLTFDQVYPLAP